MLEKLKQEVCEANLQLVREGLVIQTWGNVSGIDRTGGLVVIKPSGVPYDQMKPEHMVVVSLSYRQSCRGQIKSQFGYTNAPGSVPGVWRNRRYCSYPQPLRYCLGAGSPRNPGPWDYPCGLFLWPHPVHPAHDSQGN